MYDEMQIAAGRELLTLKIIKYERFKNASEAFRDMLGMQTPSTVYIYDVSRGP